MAEVRGDAQPATLRVAMTPPTGTVTKADPWRRRWAQVVWDEVLSIALHASLRLTPYRIATVGKALLPLFGRSRKATVSPALWA